MNEKIKGHQLERGAYVYVRQSTPYQVRNHLESKERQYALAQRASQLGFQKVIRAWCRTRMHSRPPKNGLTGAGFFSGGMLSSPTNSMTYAQTSGLPRNSARTWWIL